MLRYEGSIALLHCQWRRRAAMAPLAAPALPLPLVPALRLAAKKIHPAFRFLESRSWKDVATAAAHRMYCSAGTSGNQDREILVQHLLVKEDQLQLLTELQKRLVQEDIDLSDLATEHSICPSKKNGGMLGWVSKGRMVPEFEEAAFSAPLNKIVRAKTKFGWHLLQVLSERQAGFLVEIQPEELAKRMKDPEFRENAQLLDVRELKEIKIASLDGFKPFPLSQFGEWGPTIGDTLDPDKDTFVMCHHGVRSLQAAQWLKSQGFSRLHNVSGGIHAYSTRVDDKVPVY
ncbi:rhodanese-like/PpiC domain-containing protein 12, chloroplastic [Selaginella moellendorffii]|uniref:rhodanese-like/PpiC domain-containing protein 12, chloroplastic n=1 Tax=Selaginella moellendorffii TaxID=88036 RepID=UPI000D1C4CD1|nr:rhodanese-like/PpiC domain-containing protein 12, chloroplastic [Selaginella moellendorffii]|eukprot:XP_024536485.1 rhodanese-like/PpiC domain-containing protein 12, chloroplastic [Selaginella moellendorffii]